MIKNNIRVLRAKSDYTQEDLAKKSGVTRQTIIAIEKNRYSPSLKLAFKIAQSLGVSLEKAFYLSKKGESNEKK